MDKSKLAYLYVGLVIILWSSTPAVAKLLLNNLDSFQVLFFISLAASLTLLLVAIFQNKLQIALKYDLKDYFHFAYMGCLGIFLYYLFMFGSLALIPAQEYTAVNYLWPILLVIFASAILREKFTPLNVLAMILSFFGVYIVVSQGDLLNLTFSNWVGVLLAFLGAASYGLFSVLGKKHDYDKLTSVMFYWVFSFVFASLAVLIFSSIRTPTLYEAVGLLWIGGAAGGIAYVFWFLALKHGDTLKISNVAYLTPFVALVYIQLLLGEKILLSSVVGLIILVAGISLQFLDGSRV